MNRDLWEVLVVLRTQAAMRADDEPRRDLRRPRPRRARAPWRSVALAPAASRDVAVSARPATTKDDVALAG